MSAGIGKEILKYKDEILKDICRLVGIQSVRGTPLPDMPYGEGPAKALEFCMELARQFGLKAKNVGNRACHVEYGSGEELVGILAHVDVVPAGEGWTMPPFSGTLRGGRIYGRGTMDDKGPAVAAIYCLKALRDLGVGTKRRIRVILGAAEETGMEDMHYYFKTEELPCMAFTPDGEYPICSMEMGILHIAITGPAPGGGILRFEAGNAPNMVPANAEAAVACSTQELSSLEKAAETFEKEGVRFEFIPSDHQCMVRCVGRAAHASTPEQGLNAAAYLSRLLAGFDRGLIGFISRNIGLEWDGKAMGIACSDVSGGLKLNLGIIKADRGAARAVLDIRYPVTMSGRDIARKIALKAEESGLDAEVMSDTAPLYIAENSPLIQKLGAAYKAAAQREPALYATGGGSYARALKNNGVAFGAGIKPLSYYNIHAADEFLEISHFMKHCEICMQAAYELACR